MIETPAATQRLQRFHPSTQLPPITSSLPSTPPLVVFTLDELALALPLASVEKVVRAVEVTPLPGAPDGVIGIVSVAGMIVPVLDLRACFGRAPRGMLVTDHLAIVRTVRRTLALLVDAPIEVTTTTGGEMIPAEAGWSRNASLRGIAQLSSGLVLIHDIERFLSTKDESALDAALMSSGTE